MASSRSRRPFWVLIVLVAAVVAVHRATRTTKRLEAVMPGIDRSIVEPGAGGVETAPFEFTPLPPPQEPRVVAAPVEAQDADEAHASNDAESATELEHELPDSPGVLAFNPACPYGNKYAGMDPKALELAQKTLRGEQSELAAPLLEERMSLGLYTEVSYAEYRRAATSTDIPAWNRPLRLGYPTARDDVRAPERVRVAEVFPNEVPGLQALRDEELWVGARIEELEVEWTSWLEK